MHPLSSKAALGLSALTLLSLGGLVVFAPGVLFGQNGIVLDRSAAMMSEIRSPGVLILLGGVIAVLGLFSKTFERPGLLVSAGLLLAYGLGRLISLPLDGLPPASLQLAAAIELGLGGWCAMLAAGTGRPSGQAA